jgi:thiol:disulfide interchange protein DsbD
MLFLFLFGLNMAGLFEFGQTAVGVGSNLTAKAGLSGSFFSGILATVVATPCAAPFLAPALGAALTLPPASSMIVFTSIALGLSMPYLIFSLFPRLVNLLPRPGQWMETFKQMMSFLLFATVAFLFWVLIGQLSESAGFSIYATLFGSLSIVGTAVAAWIYGRWAPYHKSKQSRILGSAIAGIVLIGAIFIGFPSATPQDSLVKWEKWEPGLAQSLADDGKTVYVDFTARWCVTCQTNKAAVFSSSELKAFIKDNEVVLMKADWTNKDSDITKELAKFDRSAVPFNLIYSANQEKPLLLPEILTAGTVLDALKAVTIK